MSTPDIDATPSAPLAAGAQLRAARQAKGVHLAILSAQLKVPVRQLEALESDALSQTSAPAYVRALALAVCRQLQLDATPILAALPPVVSPLAKPIDSIEPLQAVHGHRAAWASLSTVPRMVWVWAALTSVAVAGFVWWPSLNQTEALVVQEAPVVMGAALPASGPMAVQPMAPAITETKTTAVPAPPVTSAVATEQAPGMRLRVTETMWVEVRDAQGQQPIKRLVKPGETVELPPPGPLFVYLAKGDRAELSWQGKAVDLGPHSQNNEVRLRLQP